MLQDWMKAEPRNFTYALAEEVLPGLSAWLGSQA